MFHSKIVKVNVCFMFSVFLSLFLIADGKENGTSKSIFGPAILQTVEAAEQSTTGIAAQTINILKPALEKEFGRIQVAEQIYEKTQIFGTVIGFDFRLEEGKLDSTWGKKVVRALEALGATDVHISMRSDSGPTAVRAKSLKIGEREAMSVQFSPSTKGTSIGVSMLVP